jgi:hypothetical protein
VTRRAIDMGELRAALRGLPRGSLLLIAERAVEAVPRARLRALLADIVRLDDLRAEGPAAASLLDEVRRFHAASLRSHYYESFNVNSKNYTTRSKGTEAFLAEFDRLLNRCVQAAATSGSGEIREAFRLMFGLLRHIAEHPDQVVFFADEGGLWQFGIDWRRVLPVWFRCIAEAAEPDEYALFVCRAIADFASHDRTYLMGAARRVANTDQKKALRSRPTPRAPGS